MSAPGRNRGRRTVIAIAVIVAAPVLLSYGFYHYFPRDRFTNYGELLPTTVFPGVAGTRLEGTPFDLASCGRWASSWPRRPPLATPREAVRDAAGAHHPGPGERARRACCWRAGMERRTRRCWRNTPTSSSCALPRVLPVRCRAAAPPPSTRSATRLAWPRDPDVKAMAKDLSRLLKASRIG
jgi:hypothetical protein